MGDFHTQPEADALRHTPLPWKFSPWHIEEGPPAVLALAGHIVCTTASDDDAAFIVEAVNSHATLQARVVELTKALEWQPIETAPHEQRVLLGWIYDGAWLCETGMATHGWRKGPYSTMSQHGHATHWMPLPGSPVVPLEQGNPK